MKISYKGAVSALILAAAMTAAAGVQAKESGRGSGPVVYVPNQGLAYDSIVLADLPNEGPFQKLEIGGPTGLQTEFGLGDPGYVGGRWWLDVNGDDIMDDGDVYFLCPLLGPGYDPAD